MSTLAQRSRALLEGREREGLLRRLRTFESAPGPRVRLEGREMLLLCSNGYLGLATHPKVVAAARNAAQRFGTSSAASRLVSGTLGIHRQLEHEAARLKGMEDAVLFGSGLLANLGTVAALAGPGDLVLSDRLNHASLIDACRLSRATVQVYGHADAAHAGRLLREHRAAHGRCLILTDGVFSMDGDVAPLRELAELAGEHDADLLVDDAHGTGVLGRHGAGTAEHLGVRVGIALHMGTFSKALASEGGFVAAAPETCGLLRNTARTFVYSTAPSPATVAAARAAIQVMQDEPGLRWTLLANARRLREGLRHAGFRVPDGETPIVPVLIGGSKAAMRVSAELERRGVFAAGIRPPTVPEGSARIRATVMATHTAADIDEAVDAFAKAGRAVGVL